MPQHMKPMIFLSLLALSQAAFLTFVFFYQ